LPTCEVPTFSQVVITRVDGKLDSKLKMWGQGREYVHLKSLFPILKKGKKVG
jgi:hypothetical protein